jgi:hypothetical protein
MTSTMTIARSAASIVTGGQIKSKRVRESNGTRLLAERGGFCALYATPSREL